MSTVEYRGKVRGRDPEASWEAASLQAESKVSRVQGVVVSLLDTYGPMTDEQLVEQYTAYAFMDSSVPNVTPQSIRTRRHEATIKGLVVNTGRHALSKLGNKATLWAVRNG